MITLLLSAGLGERLKPLTQSTPKPLLSVLNMPCIEYTIRNFASFGINTFMANSFHLADILEKDVAKMNIEGLKISFSREDELLGTGGGIKKMLASTDEETVIISNTDIIHNFDIKSLIEIHNKKGNAISLVMLDHKQGSNYSKIGVSSSGFIEKFGCKSDTIKPNARLAFFTGIHIYTKSKLPRFTDLKKFCIVKDYYEKIIADGGKIGAVFTKGDWIDIGDKEKLFHENLNMLSRYKNFEVFSKYISLEYSENKNNILIHKSSKISRDVKLFGPTLIGKNVKIGGGSDIGPDIIIDDNSTIGKGVSLTQSILLEESNIPDNTAHKKTIIQGTRAIDIA